MIPGQQTGICPSCEGVGPIGETCENTVCSKRGYRHIPGEHAPEPGDTAPDPLIGRQVADYLVVKLLGVGGFGRVFLALQRPILLKTALKILDVRNLPEQMVGVVHERFEREAAALALLQHPNVVRLIQYGVFEGAPYLVMEYIADGRTLAQEMRRRAAQGAVLDAEALRSVFRQLCLGLGAAHEADIVHRDIKPDNLMLQQAEGHPNLLRILDFGLAKYVGNQSRTITTMGTPEFMAPEQLKGEQIGPWTDVYAVGLLLVELLTGRRAYTGETLTELMSQITDPAYDPLVQVKGIAVPDPLLGVLRRATARDPRQRFRDAHALNAALGPALEGLERGWSPPPLWDVARLSEKPNLQEAPTQPIDDPGVGASASSADASPSASATREAFQRWLDEEGQRLDRSRAQLSSERARRKGRSDK